MNAPGNIFVFIFVGAVILASVSSLIGKFSKPAQIKEKYKNEIKSQREGLKDEPERFEGWLRNRQFDANKDEEDRRNGIAILIAIPVTLIISSLILAWIYSP